MDYSQYFWQGEKVRLRPVTVDDAEQSFAATLESPARRVLQLGLELPTTLEAEREALARHADCKDVNGVILMSIEDLESNRVGRISLHSKNRKNGTFGMGLIVDAAHRRKGYALEAARILMRYCFHERRYQKCCSGCVHTNEASIAFHEKAGFVQEGRRRRQFYMDGQYVDDILFGLTREEFEASLAR